jgi:peptidoglycan/xylan/chitin deacetylase (PgdA/CDA1 family)
VLQEAGLEYISWRIRSCDTMIRNPNFLARRILSNVASRDIILMHDRLPKGTQVTLEILPGIIDELKERGFEFVLAGSRETVHGHADL